MTEFRVYCLDSDNKIIRGETVHVEDLPQAIEAARGYCQPPGAHPERVEIWRGATRVYP